MHTRWLSSSRLAAPNGLLHRLCKQCDEFLTSGLPSLKKRIEEKKYRRVDSEEAERIGLAAAKNTEEIEPRNNLEEGMKSRARFQSRTASAMEKDLFRFHSLSVELYIEGFIKGLEAAGIDRKFLSREAEAAVNNLLHIAQTLAGERRRIYSDDYNRADLRRLGRHIDDTSLMVNEYVRAVTEECLEPGLASRYMSSHGREQTERPSSHAQK